MPARLPTEFRRLVLPAAAALLLSTAACTPPQDAYTAVEPAAEPDAEPAAGPTDEPLPEAPAATPVDVPDPAPMPEGVLESVDADAATMPPIAGCDAEAAQSFIGQVATDDVVAEAQAAAGAELVRKLGPGQMATMDFRAERLNVMVDDGNIIVSASCG